MTVCRKYYCNLCNTELAEIGSAESSWTRHGVGIYFHGNEIRFKLLRDTEHHICDECVKAIVVESAELERLRLAKEG